MKMSTKFRLVHFLLFTNLLFFRVTGNCVTQPMEGAQKGGEANRDVWSVSYSTDGKLLASGSFDGTVKLWDALSGALVRTLEGHTDKVRGVAFNKKGDLLASTGDDRTVKLWDVASGRELKTFREKSPDAIMTSVAFSPDGKFVASSSLFLGVSLWEISTGHRVPLTSQGTSNSVVFSPNGRFVASISGIDKETYGSKITLWEVEGNRVVRTMVGQGSINSLAFSPDGNLLASASLADGTIELWEIKTGRKVRALKGHVGAEATSVAFSPDGRLLASAGFDRKLKLWNVTDGTELRTLESCEAINSVTFSPDGRIVVTGNLDMTKNCDSIKVIRSWEVSTGKEIELFQTGSRLKDTPWPTKQ